MKHKVFKCILSIKTKNKKERTREIYCTSIKLEEYIKTKKTARFVYYGVEGEYNVKMTLIPTDEEGELNGDYAYWNSNLPGIEKAIIYTFFLLFGDQKAREKMLNGIFTGWRLGDE